MVERAPWRVQWDEHFGDWDHGWSHCPNDELWGPRYQLDIDEIYEGMGYAPVKPHDPNPGDVGLMAMHIKWQEPWVLSSWMSAPKETV